MITAHLKIHAQSFRIEVISYLSLILTWMRRKMNSLCSRFECCRLPTESDVKGPRGVLDDRRGYSFRGYVSVLVCGTR